MFLSLYLRIDILIYSAPQLQQRLVNLLTYLLTYPDAHRVTITRLCYTVVTTLWSSYMRSSASWAKGYLTSFNCYVQTKDTLISFVTRRSVGLGRDGWVTRAHTHSSITAATAGRQQSDVHVDPATVVVFNDLTVYTSDISAKNSVYYFIKFSLCDIIHFS